MSQMLKIPAVRCEAMIKTASGLAVAAQNLADLGYPDEAREANAQAETCRKRAKDLIDSGDMPESVARAYKILGECMDEADRKIAAVTA